MKNQAVIIVRPKVAGSLIAMTVVKNILDDQNVEIIDRRILKGSDIIASGLLANHYGRLAEHAAAAPEKLTPNNIAKRKFAAEFDENWDDALASGRIMGAVAALAELNMDEMGIGRLWAENGAVELAPDLFISHFVDDGIDAFVVNGFYHAMCSEFKIDNAFAIAMLVEFDFSWKKFNNEVSGAENPACADENSIRGYIYDHAGLLGIFIDAVDNVILASRNRQETARYKRIWMT